MVNYIDSFPNALLAQGLNESVLIVTKLDAPVKRFDGKRVSFQMEHRWLSETCQSSDDEAWACVQGSDFTYWSATELKALGLRPGRKSVVPDGYSLFDHVLLT